MQLFKHAYFSLKYNKIRWLLMFVFLFLYLNLFFSLIDSVEGFRKEIDRSKDKYAKQVQLFPLSEEAAQLSHKELENYGLSDYIDRIDYDGYLYLEPVRVEDYLNPEQRVSVSALTSMIGVLPNKELKKKMASLSFDMPALEGKECLVSQTYAESENVSIGDVVSYWFNQSRVDFTVKGIYESTVETIYMAHMYLSSEALEAAEPTMYSQIQWYSVYHLKNSEAFADFSQEVKEKGLSELYQIVSNESLYQEETVFLNEALKRSGYGLIGTVLVGIIALFARGILFKRKQTAEIGFFYSSGVSKGKMILMDCSNNFLLLLAVSLLTFLSVRNYVSFFTQFMLNGTIEAVTTQTVSLFSTNSFSVITSIVEPIRSIHVEAAYSVGKIFLLLLLCLVLSAGKIIEIRRFQFSGQLVEAKDE